MWSPISLLDSLQKHERVHCSIVHGVKLKHFRNILAFINIDATSDVLNLIYN